MLHREHAELLARAQPRDRVGHMQADPFLAHDDRPDIAVRDIFQQVIDRIADDAVNTLALQNLDDRFDCFHGRTLPGGDALKRC
ncbi:MAG: hypothetical protein VW709_17625 [Rickettsiales bacterium]